MGHFQPLKTPNRALFASQYPPKTSFLSPIAPLQVTPATSPSPRVPHFAPSRRQYPLARHFHARRRSRIALKGLTEAKQ